MFSAGGGGHFLGVAGLKQSVRTGKQTGEFRVRIARAICTLLARRVNLFFTGALLVLLLVVVVVAAAPLLV